jgi:hypothetical protein
MTATATVRRAASSKMVSWLPHVEGSSTPKTVGPSSIPTKRASTGGATTRFMSSENSPMTTTNAPITSKAMFKALMVAFPCSPNGFWPTVPAMLPNYTA